MSLLLLQELERNGDKIKEDMWCHAGSDFALDGLLEILSHLHTQLKVQSALQSIATLLRQHPRNKSLPNQQATRVKHFIKFVFEKTTRGYDRQAELRKLDCSALKVCGLSFTVKEVLELPSAEFHFLIENVADFVLRQKLTQHLYREDINKALNSDFNPENDEIFKEFLKSHIELRLAERKRDRDGQRIGPDKKYQSGKAAEHGEEEAKSPTRSTERGHGVDGPVLYNEHREIKYMCTNALASDILRLPEPFKTAVKNSRLWKWERSQGPDLETTGCLSTLFPKNNEHDVSFTIFCGNNDGYVLNDFFGLATSS